MPPSKIRSLETPATPAPHPRAKFLCCPHPHQGLQGGSELAWSEGPWWRKAGPRPSSERLPHSAPHSTWQRQLSKEAFPPRSGSAAGAKEGWRPDGDGASLLGTSASRSGGARRCSPASGFVRRAVTRAGVAEVGLPLSAGEAILSRAAPNWQPTDAPAVADRTSAAPPAPFPEPLPSPAGSPKGPSGGSTLGTGCGEPEAGTPGREGLAERDSSRPPAARSPLGRGFAGGEPPSLLLSLPPRSRSRPVWEPWAPPSPPPHHSRVLT